MSNPLSRRQFLAAAGAAALAPSALASEPQSPEATKAALAAMNSETTEMSVGEYLKDENFKDAALNIRNSVRFLKESNKPGDDNHVNSDKTAGAAMLSLAKVSPPGLYEKNNLTASDVLDAAAAQPSPVRQEIYGQGANMRAALLQYQFADGTRLTEEDLSAFSESFLEKALKSYPGLGDISLSHSAESFKRIGDRREEPALNAALKDSFRGYESEIAEFVAECKREGMDPLYGLLLLPSSPVPSHLNVEEALKVIKNSPSASAAGDVEAFAGRMEVFADAIDNKDQPSPLNPAAVSNPAKTREVPIAFVRKPLAGLLSMTDQSPNKFSKARADISRGYRESLVKSYGKDKSLEALAGRFPEASLADLATDVQISSNQGFRNQTLRTALDGVGGEGTRQKIAADLAAAMGSLEHYIGALQDARDLDADVDWMNMPAATFAPALKTLQAEPQIPDDIKDALKTSINQQLGYEASAARLKDVLAPQQEVVAAVRPEALAHDGAMA